MATTGAAQPAARLMLPGSATQAAEIEVIFQSRATRTTRAILVLGTFIAVMPVVFFLPPHFLWPIVSLAVGLYLARRYWRCEYYVVRFQGSCPRCGTDLELASGARIRGRQSLECFGCHRHPELVLDDPEA